MFRILSFARRRMFFFKRFRIGIRLVRSSFKTVTFEHNKYFIFCFIIAFIHLFRIMISSYIDPKIARSILLTEFFVGQNFFDVLVDYLELPVNIPLTGLKTIIFFVEMVIFYYTTLTLIYFTVKNLSYSQSFLLALKKSRTLIMWILIEMLILFLTALLGILGDLIQFVWSLITALSLQVIAFEEKNVRQVLKQSLLYLKRMFSNIVGIDLFIDFIFALLTGIFYFLYKSQVVPTFTFLSSTNNNIMLTSLIFYIFATISVSETIMFTRLYSLFHKYPKLLKK